MSVLSIILSGLLRANVFDRVRRLAGQVDARAGECIVLLAGGHGYEILEDGTRVLEIKNGPYLGADADRVRI